MKGYCECCGEYGELEKCHIKTKKTGGGTEWENILLMCRRDHQLQHQVGFYALSKRYEKLRIQLELRGWGFENEFGIMKLRRV